MLPFAPKFLQYSCAISLRVQTLLKTWKLIWKASSKKYANIISSSATRLKGTACADAVCRRLKIISEKCWKENAENNLLADEREVSAFYNHLIKKINWQQMENFFSEDLVHIPIILLLVTSFSDKTFVWYKLKNTKTLPFKQHRINIKKRNQTMNDS